MRGGTREDRMMRSVQTTIPPLIASRDYPPSVTEILATEQTLLQVAQADTDAERHSARIAAAASRKTIARLTALPSQWREELKPRRGSAADILIDALYDHPIISAHEVEAIAKTASASATYRAIDKLTAAGLIEEVTGRARDRVWAASEITSLAATLRHRNGSRPFHLRVKA